MNRLKNYRYVAMTVLGILSLMATLASSGPYSQARSAQTTSDISVQISADRDMVKAGQNIKFTVTATNQGPDDATFVDVAINLSSDFTIVAMQCDLGTSPDGPFCEYSSLPSGATVVATLVATPRTDIQLHSRLATTSTTTMFEDPGPVDPDTSNNSAMVKTKIIGRVSLP